MRLLLALSAFALIAAAPAVAQDKSGKGDSVADLHKEIARGEQRAKARKGKLAA